MKVCKKDYIVIKMTIIQAGFTVLGWLLSCLCFSSNFFLFYGDHLGGKVNFLNQFRWKQFHGLESINTHRPSVLCLQSTMDILALIMLLCNFNNELILLMKKKKRKMSVKIYKYSWSLSSFTSLELQREDIQSSSPICSIPFPSHQWTVTEDLVKVKVNPFQLPSQICCCFWSLPLFTQLSSQNSKTWGHL